MSAVRTRAMGFTASRMRDRRTNLSNGAVRVADMQYMKQQVESTPTWLSRDDVFTRILCHWMVGLQPGRDKFVAVFSDNEPSFDRWKQISAAMLGSKTNIITTSDPRMSIGSVVSLSSMISDVQILSGNPLYYQLVNENKSVSCFGLFLEEDQFKDNHHLARSYSSLLPFTSEAAAWEISKLFNGNLSEDSSCLSKELSDIYIPNVEGILKVYSNSDLSQSTYSMPILENYSPPSAENLRNTLDELGVGHIAINDS